MNSKIATYTPELTEAIVTEYQAGQTVEQIALTHGRSTRSIIAKLAQLHVYVAKAPKAAVDKTTKLALARETAERLGLDTEALDALEKADKVTLINLHAAVAKLVTQ